MTDRAPEPAVPGNWTRIDPFPRLHTMRSFVSETLDTDRIRVDVLSRGRRASCCRARVWFGPGDRRTSRHCAWRRGGGRARRIGRRRRLDDGLPRRRGAADGGLPHHGSESAPTRRLEASIAGVDGRKVTCRARPDRRRDAPRRSRSVVRGLEGPNRAIESSVKSIRHAQHVRQPELEPPISFQLPSAALRSRRSEIPSVRGDVEGAPSSSTSKSHFVTNGLPEQRSGHLRTKQLRAALRIVDRQIEQLARHRRENTPEIVARAPGGRCPTRSRFTREPSANMRFGSASSAASRRSTRESGVEQVGVPVSEKRESLERRRV